jgi:hypothetical protein
MSAAVWNEPHVPEPRCRDTRRPTGASWDSSVLTKIATIHAPRPPADHDPRVTGTTVRR